jgi:hypothetical protein
LTEREFRDAIEAAAADSEQRARLAEKCMPVLIERRCDGYQHMMLVPLGTALTPLPDGDWFVPKMPLYREIA